MVDPLRPSIEEANYFIIASVLVGAAFTAFSGVLTLESTAFYLGIGLAVLSLRELGQRTIAHWMDAEVDLQLSPEGSMVTVMGAVTAVLTGWPVILLFPVTNSFDVESYEQWGKSIDAMWLKREYWIVSGGVLALMGGWILGASLEFIELSRAISFFAFFQLLPFDYSGIPTGKTDGATLLRQSGFYWALFMGLTLASFALI